MSYGIGSGESYVSALTLMFFNDTNQYIVDLDAGTQRIYPASGADSDLAADVSGAVNTFTCLSVLKI